MEPSAMPYRRIVRPDECRGTAAALAAGVWVSVAEFTRSRLAKSANVLAADCILVQQISDRRPSLSSSFPIPQKRRGDLPLVVYGQISLLLSRRHFPLLVV